MWTERSEPAAGTEDGGGLCWIGWIGSRAVLCRAVPLGSVQPARRLRVSPTTCKVPRRLMAK
jgi:hypothetical protein